MEALSYVLLVIGLVLGFGVGGTACTAAGAVLMLVALVMNINA